MPRASGSMCWEAALHRGELCANCTCWLRQHGQKLSPYQELRRIHRAEALMKTKRAEPVISTLLAGHLNVLGSAEFHDNSPLSICPISVQSTNE